MITDVKIMYYHGINHVYIIISIHLSIHLSIHPPIYLPLSLSLYIYDIPSSQPGRWMATKPTPPAAAWISTRSLGFNLARSPRACGRCGEFHGFQWFFNGFLTGFGGDLYIFSWDSKWLSVNHVNPINPTIWGQLLPPLYSDIGDRLSLGLPQKY